MRREHSLLMLSKIVLAFVAINALAGGRADGVAGLGWRANFFWPIQTPINAALLGALYLAGAGAVTFVIIRNSWEVTRFFVPVLVTAGILISVVTWLHRDKFVMDGRFWYWMGVYAIAPLLVLFLYWMQERAGASWHATVPVRPVTRWVAVLTGVAILGVSVPMLVLPQRFVEVWPWATTPLLTRIFAAWFAAFGAGLLWFLVERDWLAMRLLPTMMLAAVVLDLAMVWLHRAEIPSVGLALWLYCGHLVAFGLVGALLLWLQREQHKVGMFELQQL